MRRLAALASFILPFALGAQASPADQAIDRAVAAYATVRTAKATFEQSITNALTGSTIPSKGAFEQARPDRFAFRFTDPKGDVILSDGKFVWLYLPSSTPGQVIRAPLTADIEGSIDLIGAFFSNPRAKYTISDAGEATINGRVTRAVNLVPRGDAGFARARVWIDDEGLLRQFEAQEHNGVSRRVRIMTYEPNATVSASAFRFTPPKGVKVVDGSTLR
ncbi:MAG: outer membrane lipoprotein chaperone LolA [Gemmatimonadaceae bacterium]|nr:outer membrane lipoprotein chaperone LolA [Gemmatimonadaceae bacterium]